MIISDLRWILIRSGVLLCGLLVGCSKLTLESDVTFKQEFVRLNSLVLALQRANHLEKEAPLAALKQSQCRSLCDFRDSCQHAFALHVSALQRMSDVRKRLTHTQNDASSAHAELNVAQSELSRAQPLLMECAAIQGQLERKLAP